MAICIWPIDITECCEQVNIDPADPRIAATIAQASEMMTRWSGYAYGGCRTVRPLSPCGECRSGCCSNGDCIVLHDAAAVTAVRMSGTIVPPADYYYDAARGTLCHVTPSRWPTADPRQEDVGTLEVDTLIGSPPDAWALSVATALACEMLRSCMGDDQCRLPANATQVTNAGITITLSDDEILHALPEVSRWALTINPARATMPGRIFSPEANRARVVGSARRWRA